MSWQDLIKKVKYIQYCLNESSDTYYSLGDTFVMLEKTFIGKCEATLEDYYTAIGEFYQVEKEDESKT